MSISQQQEQILEVAITASFPLKPKYIIERTGLAYGPVVAQLDRLVQKLYLLNTKRTNHRVVSRASCPKTRRVIVFTQVLKGRREFMTQILGNPFP